MSNKLKVLDFEKDTQFTANGVTYYVEKGCSFKRYDYLTACTLRFAYGRDYDSISTAVNKAVEYMDKARFVAAAVELNNITQGIKAFPDRVNDAFAVCAIFINAEGEDRGEFTGEMIGKKIEDWSKEGLDALPFVLLAATLSGNLLRDFRLLMAEGSGESIPLTDPSKKNSAE